jgi:hypothetical protein
MHRDEPDEMLESLEGLLGILEQSEIEAKSIIVFGDYVFRMSRTLKIVNNDDRVEADVLRGALEDSDRLLLSQDVERIFGVVRTKQRELRAQYLGNRTIPASVDEEDMKSWSIACERFARLSRTQSERLPWTSAGIGMLFHGHGSAYGCRYLLTRSGGPEVSMNVNISSALRSNRFSRFLWELQQSQASGIQ